MTLAQFELHRPKLYRALSEFLAAHWAEPGTDVKDWEIDFEIEPSYWNGILFIARSCGLCNIVYLKEGEWAWEKDLSGPSNRIPPHWGGP